MKWKRLENITNILVRLAGREGSKFQGTTCGNGTVMYDSARGMILAIATQAILDRINDMMNIAHKSCKDEGDTFVYEGETLSCDLVADDSLDSEGYYGANIFTQAISNWVFSESAGEAEEFYGYGNQSKYAEKWNNKLNKNGGGGGSSSSSNSKYNGEDLYSFSSESGYYPSIVNIYQNSKNLDNAGELKSGSGTLSDSLKEVIKEAINILGLFGRYIMYAALMFYGVGAIWGGAEGKAKFKETLPYILVSIIFFFSAPKIVDIFQNKILATGDYERLMENLFASLVYIARILAFCGIIFTGLRLMFGSLEKKQEIKKMFIAIFVGCIFVFASSFIVRSMREAVYSVTEVKKELDFGIKFSDNAVI